MPRCLSPAYKGPAILVLVGVSFAAVGSIPVVITICMGIKNSATIIGVGFMGFGAMMILPGICWCFFVQHRTCSRWKQRRRLAQEETPALCAMGQSYGGMDGYPDSPAQEPKLKDEEEAIINVNEEDDDQEKCLKER